MKSEVVQKGRPSGYDPKFAKMLIEYFEVEPYHEKMKKIVTKSGDVVEIPVIEAADFPSLAGFAISIGFSRDTLHEWSKVHKEFSDAYKRAKDFQERFLAVNGNKGLINPAFSIFTAKNVLKWTDRQEIEQTTNHNVSPVDVSLLSEYVGKLDKAKKDV